MFMFFEHCVFVRLNDSSSFFEVVLIGLYMRLVLDIFLSYEAVFGRCSLTLNIISKFKDPVGRYSSTLTISSKLKDRVG